MSVVLDEQLQLLSTFLVTFVSMVMPTTSKSWQTSLHRCYVVDLHFHWLKYRSYPQDRHRRQLTSDMIDFCCSNLRRWEWSQCRHNSLSMVVHLFCSCAGETWQWKENINLSKYSIRLTITGKERKRPIKKGRNNERELRKKKWWN